MQQDNQYLVDILHAANRVVEKTATLSLEDFYADVTIQDSVVRRLLCISKAARRVSDDTIQQLEALPWSAMRNLTHQLSQADDDIDPDVLWSIIQTEIPMLIQTLGLNVLVNERPTQDHRVGHFA